MCGTHTYTHTLPHTHTHTHTHTHEAKGKGLKLSFREGTLQQHQESKKRHKLQSFKIKLKFGRRRFKINPLVPDAHYSER